MSAPCGLAAAVLIGLLTACQSVGPTDASRTPNAPPASEPLSSVASASDAVEPLLAQAERLTREQRWHEASLHWEWLTMLQPGVASYQSALAQTRTKARESAEAHLASAAAARRRGDTEAAMRAYLRALAARPDDSVAFKALQELERERARRQVNSRPRTTSEN